MVGKNLGKFGPSGPFSDPRIVVWLYDKTAVERSAGPVGSSESGDVWWRGGRKRHILSRFLESLDRQVMTRDNTNQLQNMKRTDHVTCDFLVSGVVSIRLSPPYPDPDPIRGTIK